MIGNDLKRFSVLTVLFAGLLIGFPGKPASALNLEPFMPGDYFAPVTLPRGELVRINVAVFGSYSSVAPHDPGKVLVMFVNQNGVILNGNGRGQTLVIEAGHAASLSYSASSARSARDRAHADSSGTGPVIVRGVVLPLAGLPWVIQSSMEIVDASGRTILVLSPREKYIVNPQPGPGG